MEIHDFASEDFVTKDWANMNSEECLKSIGTLDDMSIKIMVSLGILGKMLKTRGDHELEKEGLTAAQAEVLLYLVHNSDTEHEITARELEMRFRVSNPTMSGILKRLEKKKWIKRTPSESDKRNKQIRLIADVNDLHKNLKMRIVQEKNKMFQGFSIGELEQMSELLLKLIHNLDEHSENNEK